MSEADTQPRKKISRRKFLIRGGLGAMGVMAVGTYAFRNPLRRSALEMIETMISPYQGSGTEPTVWFEITKDNEVVFWSPKVEMGQGTFTGLAQMAADELEVNISQMRVEAAATKTGIVDGMSTGGSLSVAQLWIPLREMAAAMRELLKAEAAKVMGVEVGALSVVDGVVVSGGSQMTYAEIAAGVDLSAADLPDIPDLKTVDEYRYIGKPVARIDLGAKVFGDSIFGVDAAKEGMLHAACIRPTKIGSTIADVDTSVAESMPGVVKVIRLNEEKVVAVVAETYPQALAARRALSPTLDAPKTWTDADIKTLLQVGNGDEMILQREGSVLTTEDADLVEMEFRTPIGAHAQIELNAALADYSGDEVEIILSTQVIGVTQRQVAEALDMPKEKVNVVPTYLGGGFGRRLNTSHAIVAAKLSKAVGKPVKYIFTRQEEFQNDTFRPPTHHIVRGKLASDGSIDSLEHHWASGDVAIGSAIFPAVMHDAMGTDVGAMRGGKVQYQKIPNVRAVQWHKTLPFATSWWRSLGLLANTFAIESVVDELAIQAEKNAAEFRLSHLADDETGARIRKVIEVAVENSAYTEEVSGGRAMGLAASIDAGSPCAQVIEISMTDRGVRVERVTCAFDCGLAVNPDQVTAQVEGAIIMALSASTLERMYLEDGALQPTNYGPYDVARLRHAPREINVHLVQGVDHPLPVGEPPLGPTGAALANALRRLTGTRQTELPLSLQA